MSSPSGTSNSSGVVTFSVKSSHSGSSNYTAIDSTDSLTLTQTASITYAVGPASASLPTVTTSPATFPADDTTLSTILVTLHDASGNLVSGKTVTLTSSRGSTDTLSEMSGVSSPTGVATFNIHSATLGSASLTAVDSTDSLPMMQSGTVTFVAGNVSPTDSTVLADLTQVNANGSSPSVITVTLIDAQFHPVAKNCFACFITRGNRFHQQRINSQQCTRSGCFYRSIIYYWKCSSYCN